MSTAPTAARRHGTGAVLPRTNGVLPIIANDPTDAEAWRNLHSHGVSLSGEIRLAWAILEMALDELDKPPSYSDRHRDPRRDARNYVASTERNYAFSFSRICELFGMDPSVARHRLLDHLEPLPPPRLSATEKRAAAKLEAKAKVITALQTGIESLSAIVAATGLTRSQVGNLVGYYLRQGVVERVGLARYRIRGQDSPQTALDGLGGVGSPELGGDAVKPISAARASKKSAPPAPSESQSPRYWNSGLSDNGPHLDVLGWGQGRGPCLVLGSTDTTQSQQQANQARGGILKGGRTK